MFLLYILPPGWCPVDELDFQLIGALCRDPLAGHEALGRAIGRSASAVRKRLDTLTNAGVLDGYVAVPDAGALGRHGVGAAWRTIVPAARLLEIPGTVWAGTTIDGSAGALAYVEDREAWVRRATAVAGSDAQEVFETSAYTGPTLGPLDLRVLRAVVQAPRSDAVALAGQCGLSAKTVRSRRAAMMESGAVRIEPVIYGERGGSITFQISTSCDTRLRPAVARALQEVVPLGDVGPMHCLLAQAPTLAEKARRLAEVRALGVEFTEVLLNDDFTWNTHAFMAIIDGELEKWTRVRKATAQ